MTAARDVPEAELRSGAQLELPGNVALSWLVPAGVMAQWQRRPAVWRLPGSPPWLRGVTYWLGRLAPVFDVALWLAPERPPQACEHVLLLSLPPGPAALRVQGIPELVPLAPEGAIGDTAVPSALREFLRPRARQDGAVVHEFEVESWLARARTPAAATEETDP